MIRSFRHKGLKALYARGDRSGVRADMAPGLIRILTLLDRARDIQEIDLPGMRLHLLKGDLAGYWSLTVTANWRLVFRFEDGDATQLDLMDYH